MKGFTVAENPMGFTAVRVHYTADPAKNPEHPNPEIAERAQKWIDQQRLLYPDPNDFEREMEINFFIGKGSRVFPQFNQTYHSRQMQINRRKVIYRSWDYGWHCPCVLLAQIDSQDRLLILREIVASQKTTKDFAQKVVDQCAAWFPFHAAGYEDYCDPAGQHVKSLESEKSEKRDVEILAGLGIHPRCEYGWSRKDGRSLIHQLLALRGDGTPGVYVDPDHCPTLTQAFLGRYIFPTKQGGKTAEDPDDETHPWADVMAALRYLVTGLRSRLGIRWPVGSQTTSARVEPVLAYHGYGTRKRR